MVAKLWNTNYWVIGWEGVLSRWGAWRTQTMAYLTHLKIKPTLTQCQKWKIKVKSSLSKVKIKTTALSEYNSSENWKSDAPDLDEYFLSFLFAA